MPMLDVVKGIACAVIVGHHLSLYGPMQLGAQALVPGWMAWLSSEGRLAVQIFLVVAGFLAAASLAPEGVLRVDRPFARIGQRYGRLAMPYLAALTVCVLVAALVRPWWPDEAVPAVPTVMQLLAHAMLLQDLLDYEALSTGVWYVAIDLQLFTLATLLIGLPHWLRERGMAAKPWWRWVGVALVFLLAAASLAVFNRDAEFDETALYFFGAYGLGMLAFWIGRATRRSTWQAAMLLLVLVGAGALLIDWRSRIATALLTALLIALAQRRDWLEVPMRWPATVRRPLLRLGSISYSLFLIHFPVLLLTSAVVAQWPARSAWVDVLGLLLTFWLSVAAAGWLHRWSEVPRASWRAWLAAVGALVASGALAIFAT
ncbi:MAG: acyltransferase [Variovorax sp.]|nr:MAG: acyltransferase [Variovorax sp.]